jgi:putative transposase
MPNHSLKLCWLHLIWSTKDCYPFFNQYDLAINCLDILKSICNEHNIYYKTGYVNPEHVHLLVDLPVDMSIKQLMQTLKGTGSHEINQKELLNKPFSWVRGYAAFSVSQNDLDKVINYINNQKEHHQKKSFHEEWEQFLKKYNAIAIQRD